MALIKKVIGKFKDEACGKQIDEFVGLRAKLYSFKLADKEYKKCKGIKKSVVKNAITHGDYKQCLFTRAAQRRTMTVIQSHKHDVYTGMINNAEDDKRIIMEDGINTLAYGHYRL